MNKSSYTDTTRRSIEEIVMDMLDRIINEIEYEEMERMLCRFDDYEEEPTVGDLAGLLHYATRFVGGDSATAPTNGAVEMIADDVEDVIRNDADDVIPDDADDADKTNQDDVVDVTETDSLAATQRDNAEATPDDSFNATADDAVDVILYDADKTNQGDVVEVTEIDSLAAIQHDNAEATPDNSLEGTADDAVEATVDDDTVETNQGDVVSAFPLAVAKKVEENRNAEAGDVTPTKRSAIKNRYYLMGQRTERTPPRRRMARIVSAAWRGITKAARVFCCCPCK